MSSTLVHYPPSVPNYRPDAHLVLSLTSVQAKLREFLALMPIEQREAAATQLAALPF